MNTPESISAFCDNLKQSLLDAQERGEPIYLDRKADIASFPDGNGIQDLAYTGSAKWTIAIGVLALPLLKQGAVFHRHREPAAA